MRDARPKGGRNKTKFATTMYISNIELNNFRNIKHAKIALSEKINVFLGDNAQGKTNLLEAIGLAAAFHSFRNATPEQMILFGELAANVTARVSSGTVTTEVEIKLIGNKKTLFENGNRLRSGNSLSIPCTAVTFTPDDLLITKKTAQYRMLSTDTAISRILPKFADTRSRLAKLYKDKLCILKNFDRTPEDLRVLDIINSEIVTFGAELIYTRGKYLKAFEKIAQSYLDYTLHEKTALELKYTSHGLSETNVGNCPGIPEIAENLKNHQAKRACTETASGRLLSGSVKDDFTTYLFGKPAKDFASQGQLRSIALCFKLAERDIAAKALGSTPILLLDDVLSELDETRRQFAMEHLGQGQVVITGTTLPDILKTARVFRVKNGEIFDN